MVEKILGAQRDFSFGEVDPALKRSDDHPARKAGLRQMVNARILNSRALQDRPGRRALYPITNSGTRTERLSISAGNVFDIQFGPGHIKIINGLGVEVGNFAGQPWASAADIQSIVYVVHQSLKQIYITFGHAMRPQVISWDGASTWSIADYTEATFGSQKRTPFYRISPQGITAQPSATAGSITVTFSAPIAVAGRAGSRIRFCGRQILLGSLINASQMNATVIEPVPPGQQLTLSATVGRFNLGDVVKGNSSGAEGVVATTPNQQTIVFASLPPYLVGDSITGGTSGATGVVLSITAGGGVGGGNYSVVASLTAGTFQAAESITSANGSATSIAVNGTNLAVQIIPLGGVANVFTTSDVVAGPSGSATVSAVATLAPQPVTVWDDEVINSFQGYPGSVFVDQFRVGFCDFPTVPGGIAWSAVNSPTDLYVDANPSNAMFEIAPGKARIFHVVPGPESNEFVFTDSRVYYIPISPTNPLKPGSVQFLLLSGDGAAQVQPRIAQEAILYVNAGQNSVMAVIATGAYLRPFNTKNLTEFHSHLFNNIQCIACPSADGTFNERYAYVLNGDGTIAVGKYDADSLASQAVPTIGWGPWSGGATVSWIGAYRSDVLFTSTYFNAGIVEILDDAQYLDCALPVNAAPAAFAPPAGMGKLWFAVNQSVSLMDQVTRSMGTYQVDVLGNIVPQNRGGEDLTVASLVAGQPWTMTVEPFAPDADPGKSVGQRMFKRRVSRFAANVLHSTGFTMARLFSGPLTPTSPALGTVMNFTRFPAWNMGDDPTKPPPQREIAERTRPLGRSFDPRVAVIKDTPGPLQILEIGMEVTI